MKAASEGDGTRSKYFIISVVSSTLVKAETENNLRSDESHT